MGRAGLVTFSFSLGAAACVSRSRPSSSVSRHHRAGWRRRRPGTRLAAPPSVGVCGSRSESSRPARCVFGADPRPALAQLLSAAAGAGGDGLLSRRARAALRRSTEGFAVAGLSLALFGGREHEIAERGRPAIDEIASLRLRTPIRAMVAFVLPPRHSLWHKKRWRDGAARTRLRRRSVHHEG